MMNCIKIHIKLLKSTSNQESSFSAPPFTSSLSLGCFCLCVCVSCRWCSTTWKGNASATGRQAAASWRLAGRSRRSSGWWVPFSKNASTSPRSSRLTTGTLDSWTTHTTTAITTTTTITTTITTIIRTTTTTTTRIGGDQTSTNWCTSRSHRISANGIWGQTRRALRVAYATRPALAWTTVRVCAAAEATTSCSRRGVNAATASFTGAAMWCVKSAE